MCGKSNFRLDKWMLKRDTKKMGCCCPGYHFFHRRGSKYCWYRVDGTGRYPGDPDFCSHYENDGIDEFDVPFDVVVHTVVSQNGESDIPF